MTAYDDSLRLVVQVASEQADQMELMMKGKPPAVKKLMEKKWKRLTAAIVRVRWDGEKFGRKELGTCSDTE